MSIRSWIGVSDFKIGNKIYFDPLELITDTTLLLEGKGEEQTSPLAWCRQVGQGRVVYIQPGHETNPPPTMIEKLLVNGVRWVAGQGLRTCPEAAQRN